MSTTAWIFRNLTVQYPVTVTVRVSVQVQNLSRSTPDNCCRSVGSKSHSIRHPGTTCATTSPNQSTSSLLIKQDRLDLDWVQDLELRSRLDTAGHSRNLESSSRLIPCTSPLDGRDGVNSSTVLGRLDINTTNLFHSLFALLKWPE